MDYEVRTTEKLKQMLGCLKESYEILKDLKNDWGDGKENPNPIITIENEIKKIEEELSNRKVK